jgi:hypothetical protein
MKDTDRILCLKDSGLIVLDAFPPIRSETFAIYPQKLSQEDPVSRFPFFKLLSDQNPSFWTPRQIAQTFQPTYFDGDPVQEAVKKMVGVKESPANPSFTAKM